MPIYRGANKLGVFIGAAIITAGVLVGVNVVESGGVAPPPCQGLALHTPGGPDGTGGCWPGEWNTGPTDNNQVVLAPPVGNDRYVYNGTNDISGKIYNAPFLVQSGVTTIRNSIINGAIETYKPGTLYIYDSIINGGSIYQWTMGGYNFNLIRTEIYGGQQSAICGGGCNWTDVYSHNPYYFADQDAHQSAWATTGNETGAPMSVTHSTLWCNVPQVSPLGGGCTADIALQPNFGPVENVTIDHNLLPPTDTGSYCLTGGYATSSYSQYAPLANNIKITNNVFGKRIDTGKCGFWGTSGSWNPAGPGNVWSNNTFTDGTDVLPNS